MKKLLVVLLALCLLISLVACSDKEEEVGESDSQLVVADSEGNKTESALIESDTEVCSEEDEVTEEEEEQEEQEEQTQPDRWTNNH